MSDVYALNGNYIQKKGELISKKVFTGGPIAVFERMGRAQLITMLRSGVYPQSKVLANSFFR
jgi:hypothetical protein